ncbi:Alpha-1,3-mannosyltransferase-like protein [Globomyces sp. JEL0801]|nr:Alpha-1,3-mannosyltransferase-like protein [Globomyces sp. JEL0801]
MTEKRRILFIHPDLGIGGAERLVVDAACGLQRNGHQIGIWTSHHDPNHAFPETNSELNVRVVGDWLPRHFWKKGHALCAILRSLYLAIVLIWHVHVEFNHYDLLIVDQVSASIPLLRLTNTKVQMADKVVVNSKFTSGIFSKTFQWISTEPEVLYPGIQLEAYDKSVDMNDEDVKRLVIDGDFVLSVNRFERKKNIQLAISAFSTLKQRMKSRFDKLALVIAGGYDHRVVENVEYLTELDQLAQELKLSTFIWKKGSKIPQKTQVIFIPSFSENQRTFLFKEALCLVYTPSHEHFGIVPVEAMYAGLPVVAVNNGMIIAVT